VRATTVLFVASIVLMTFACRSSNPDKIAVQAHTVQPPMKQTSHEARRIPPGKCRIVASVVEIHKDELSAAASDPCSRVPCTATVRVDSVLGYGPGVTHPIAKGDTLRVRFAFTLAPSRENYPRLQQELPGLSVHATFQADMDIQTGGSPADGAPEVRYLVYAYSLVRP